MSEIEWVTKWFCDLCDGDWEHENGIDIRTCDNPCWTVTIGINYTSLANVEFQTGLVENSEFDWYNMAIKDGVFSGAGDMEKLDLILSTFRKLVEENGATRRID